MWVARALTALLALPTGLAEFTYFAQYVKFRTVETRVSNADSVAIAELYLYDPDQNWVDLSSATATNPFGSNGDHAGADALDKVHTTKWLDFNKGDLIISLPSPYTAIQYCGMQLASDHNERDPVKFELLLSQDNVNWVMVYYNSDPAVITDFRSIMIERLPLSAQFKDFLFEPIAARDGNQEVQVAEFQLWDGATPPAEMDLAALGAQAVSWQNIGTSPAGEEPSKAIDGDVTTSWVEMDIQSSTGIHIRLTNPVHVSNWSWVTGSSLTSRDPLQWNFYGLYMETGSNNMMLLNLQDTDFDAPLSRETSVGMLSIAGMLELSTTTTTTSSTSSSGTSSSTASTSSTTTTTSISSVTSTSSSSTAATSLSATSTFTSSTSTSSFSETSTFKSSTSTSSSRITMSSTSMTTSLTSVSGASTSSSTFKSSTSTSSSRITMSSTSMTSLTSVSGASTSSSTFKSITSTSSSRTTLSSTSMTTSLTSVSAASTSSSSVPSSSSTTTSTPSSPPTTTTVALSSTATFTHTATLTALSMSTTTSTQSSTSTHAQQGAAETSTTSWTFATWTQTTVTAVTVTAGDAASLPALSTRLAGDLEDSQLGAIQQFKSMDSSSNTTNSSQFAPEVYGTVLTVPHDHVGTPLYTSLLRAGPNETGAGSIQVSVGDSLVVVPTALFTSAVRPEYAVISVSDAQPGDEISEVLSASTRASGNVLATQPISIKLSIWERSINGTLNASINFTIPITQANATGDVTCVYWDEQQDRWSSQGVATLSVADGFVQCSTTHLSLFAAVVAAVVNTLVCSNAAGIFSVQGLQSLLEWHWAVRAPALVQWVTLLVGLVLLLAAKHMDLRHMERVDALEGFQHIKVLRPVGPSRKDFVADLKEYFLGALHPTRRVASQLLKRSIGLGTGELNRLRQVSGVTGWHQQARSVLSHFSEQKLLFKLTMLYQVNCRWFSFATPSLKATCTQRCSVLLAKLYSGWAIMALFYDSTALAPGQPECAPPEALLDKLVRSAVVAWISAAFGSLPFVMLLAVVHLGGNRARSLRTNIFWSYMTLHTTLCALVVSIFLASVSPADEEKFLISSLTNLFTSVLVTPLLLTVLFGICLLSRQGDLGQMLQWRQDDQFGISIESVEIPLEQLHAALKLDSRLAVTVVVEVFGDHSSSVNLKMVSDSGNTFSSTAAILVTKNQVLFFTIVLVELQRRSTRTLHAVVLGGDVITGYSGSLPLFLAGKSSPCAEAMVQVGLSTRNEEKLDTNGKHTSKDKDAEAGKEVVTIDVVSLEKPLKADADQRPDHLEPRHDVPLRAAAAAPRPQEGTMTREMPPPDPTPKAHLAEPEPAPEPLLPAGSRLLELPASAPPKSMPRMGPCLRPQARTVGAPRPDPRGRSNDSSEAQHTQSDAGISQL